MMMITLLKISSGVYVHSLKKITFWEIVTGSYLTLIEHYSRFLTCLVFFSPRYPVQYAKIEFGILKTKVIVESLKSPNAVISVLKWWFWRWDKLPALPKVLPLLCSCLCRFTQQMQCKPAIMLSKGVTQPAQIELVRLYVLLNGKANIRSRSSDFKSKMYRKNKKVPMSTQAGNQWRQSSSLMVISTAKIPSP